VRALSIGGVAVAQVTFDRAAVTNTGVVTVNVTSNAAAFTAALPQLQEAGNWRIFFRGDSVPVDAVQVDQRLRVVRLDYDRAAMTLPESNADLNAGELRVEFRPPGAAPIRIVNRVFQPTRHGVKLTANRKDADVDISGGFQAAADASTLYYWTIKAAYPFYLPRAWGRIAPTFDGQASKQTNADPDSLKASVVHVKRWPLSGRMGFSLTSDLLGYEFERVARAALQKNTNLMWSSRLRFVHGWAPLNYIIGFAGFEAASIRSTSIRRDSRGEERKSIFRPRFDADVYRNFFPGDRTITFDAHYTLRLPRREEPFQQAGINGSAPFLTTKPRHWVNANLSFQLVDGIGLTTQYRWGSLPPSFEMVSHQATIGFNVLLKRR
jgi:hypothetical protein